MKIKRNFNENFAQIFISRILIFLHDKYFAKFLFIRKSARRVYFCCPIPGGDLRFGSIFCLPFYSKISIVYEIFCHSSRLFFSTPTSIFDNFRTKIPMRSQKERPRFWRNSGKLSKLLEPPIKFVRTFQSWNVPGHTLPLAETVFPLAETAFPLAETAFPLAETEFPLGEHMSPPLIFGTCLLGARSNGRFSEHVCSGPEKTTKYVPPRCVHFASSFFLKRTKNKKLILKILRITGLGIRVEKNKRDEPPHPL